MYNFITLATAVLLLPPSFAWTDMPQDPELAAFKVGEGLSLDLIARDPEIAQPLNIAFDPRGRMWVVQYRQYPFPAGLEVAGHDMYWRIQYKNFPPPPPPRGPKGEDRITIFEDADGDGSFETHKDFLTGLNICTSVLPAGRNIYVLNPPYLLRYEDRNEDDLPDRDPEVLLEGFGLEDLHAVANSLTWGPDGWIYGCQGSTCTAKIKRHGRPDSEALSFNGQCIWRFNPDTEAFELFAEGGYNNFGLAHDDAFRLFTGSNGGFIGVHYVQGGYYWKNWGKHGPLTNPYAFGYFDPMEDHSSRAKLSQAMCFYNDNLFPERLRDKLIVARVMQGRIDACELRPKGSTYSAHEIETILSTESRHFRPVDLKLGPDGAIYIADWYDTNVTWNVSAEGHGTDKSSGRIYRLRAADAPAACQTPPPADLDDAGLIDRLKHPNRWQRETARQLLRQHGDAALVPQLVRAAKDSTGQLALEYFWAVDALGGTMDTLTRAMIPNAPERLGSNYEIVAASMMSHPEAAVRMWAMRLLYDSGSVERRAHTSTLNRIYNETDPQVRSQAASSARRIEQSQGLAIVDTLLARDSDAADPHIPLQLWWAVESLAQRMPTDIVGWATGEIREKRRRMFVQTIWPRLGRFFAMQTGPAAQAHLAALAAAAPDAPLAISLLEGVAQAIQDGADAAVHDAVRPQMMQLLAQSPENPEYLALALRLRLPEAAETARAIIANPERVEKDRAALAKTLAAWHAPQDLPLFLQLLKGDAPEPLKAAALDALMAHSGPEIGTDLLDAWNRLPANLRGRAAGLLASRETWARALVDRVQAGAIAKEQVPLEAVAALRMHENPELQQAANSLWGMVRQSPQEILAKINAVRSIVTNIPGDAAQGKTVFAEICAKCHVFNDDGRKVGPDLTGVDRKNLEYLLEAVIDPNNKVLPEFMGTVFTIASDDELGGEATVSGFVVEENAEIVKIVDASGNELTVPAAKILARRPMPLSVMPEGLLDGMHEDRIRNLFAYLQD